MTSPPTPAASLSYPVAVGTCCVHLPHHLCNTAESSVVIILTVVRAGHSRLTTQGRWFTGVLGDHLNYTVIG